MSNLIITIGNDILSVKSNSMLFLYKNCYFIKDFMGKKLLVFGSNKIPLIKKTIIFEIILNVSPNSTLFQLYFNQSFSGKLSFSNIKFYLFFMQTHFFFNLNVSFDSIRSC